MLFCQQLEVLYLQNRSNVNNEVQCVGNIEFMAIHCILHLIIPFLKMDNSIMLHPSSLHGGVTQLLTQAYYQIILVMIQCLFFSDQHLVFPCPSLILCKTKTSHMAQELT